MTPLAHLERGEIQAANALLSPLAASNQANAAFCHAWGICLGAMGDEPAGIAALRRAVSIQQTLAPAWRALGDMLLVVGQGVQAGEAYAHGIRAAVRQNYLVPAATSLAQGHAPAAYTMLQAYLRQNTNDPAALDMFAAAAMRAGQLAQAESALAHCLSIAPDFEDAHHSAAILFHIQGKFGRAVPEYEWLLNRAPHDTGLQKLFAASLMRSGDFARAIPVYESLLHAWRAQPKVWLQQGHALRVIGREAEAAAAYRTSIEFRPANGAAWLSLADMKTVAFTDAEIAALRTLAANPQATTEDRARLNYALGAALEQRHAYADSFAHYKAGAAARRSMIQYDPATTEADMAGTAALFTPTFFTARTGRGHPSAAPIFVLGLARSGSTLVEQILASHPQVEGTTELEEIGLIDADLRRAAQAKGQNFPAFISQLDNAALARLGERYLEKTQQFRHTGRPHFIDKMPANFLHCGLIHLILPNARIIDISRAPMAAGFAVFKQYFQDAQTGQNYSYNLTEIGRYWRAYRTLMAHFETALPGRIHHIQYENLVQDTEQEIRALLNYCGLPFDPACLSFWETPRAVQTPSAEQVRRPISQAGLAQWQNYAEWLGPLGQEIEKA